MKSYEEWMVEYLESHRHPLNQKIHKLCVPLILFTVIGFLWSLPTPDIFSFLPYLNWATFFASFWLMFYLNLNFKLFLGMLLQIIFMFWLSIVLKKAQILLPFSITFFILGWIAQFYGHKVEGKSPSFFKDIFFLLIGPLWVTKLIYEKLGIKV